MAYNPNSTTYTTSRISVSGTLSADGTKITYVDDGGTTHENVVLASTIFNTFKNKSVEITISTQDSTSTQPTYGS